jgi:AAA domain
MSTSTIPHPSPPARALSQLTPRPLAWLWPGRLALGKLSLLEGDPQRGKSLLTLDLCARLSTGRPWPDDSPSGGPAAALILNGEDGDEDTTIPRLQTLGADLGRCFVLERGHDGGPAFYLPTRTDVLDAALVQTKARLVVIDPVMAFLAAGVNTASDLAMRRTLWPLAQLAELHCCAVLLVRHLNKSGGRRALYRGLGSIGLVAACRSAWLAAADPRAEGHGVLAQVKNNLAPAQPSLAFEVRQAGEAGPSIAWLGPTDWTADALLAAAGARPARLGPREQACQFLLEALHDGPRTSRELWAEARRLGLSERTLLRAARKELDMRLIRRCEDGKTVSYWLLPGQHLAPAAAPAEENELDRFLREMHERFPEPTPLDDL